MRGLIGTIGYHAGASGTVTIPKGAQLLQIVVHASAGSATVTIFGGDAIPVVNGSNTMFIQFLHTLWQAFNNATTAGSQDVVFVNTDSYFVEYIKSGNT